jgi:predicted nucleic acid-binding protein
MASTMVAIIIIVVAVVVIAALLWLATGQRRARLRKAFGPEYDRTVAAAGSKREAEAELRERLERHDKLRIVPLQPAARTRYLEAWHQTQAQFVDQPAVAVQAADRLITEVMRERGYPVEDFEQRAADVSVEHPQVVDDYRTAHAIATKDRGAGTEDLRQAMVHYRSLFEELLEVGQPDGSRFEAAGARPDGSPDRAQPAETEASTPPAEPERR